MVPCTSRMPLSSASTASTSDHRIVSQRSGSTVNIMPSAPTVSTPCAWPGIGTKSVPVHQSADHSVSSVQPSSSASMPSGPTNKRLGIVSVEVVADRLHGLGVEVCVDIIGHDRLAVEQLSASRALERAEAVLGTVAELASVLAECLHLLRSRPGVGELIQKVDEGPCHPRVRTVGGVGRDVGERVPGTDEQPVVTNSIAERVAPELLVRAGVRGTSRR